MAESSPRLGVRPLEAADLPGLLELARQALPELILDEDDVTRQVLGDSGGRPAWRLGCFDGECLLAAAVAVARLPGTGAHWKLLVGSPWSGALLGLHDAVCESLAETGIATVATDGAAPLYLLPGWPARDTPGLQRLVEIGYSEVERRASMTAVLGDDLLRVSCEPVTAGAGLHLRRAAPTDVQLLERDIGRAFSADWAQEAVAALSRKQAVTHIALEGDRLVGFATAGLWARNAFGPMGTLPGFEGRGIGSALLRRCLADLRRAGQRTAVISWVGPESFYERHANARRTLEYVYLERRLPSPSLRASCRPRPHLP